MIDRPAVFLDRDGVLIEDVPLLTRRDQVRLAEGAAWAVSQLAEAGFVLAVASNQPVVARGLATEGEVAAINDHIQQLLVNAAGRGVDAFYVCPHHPNATLAAYRQACSCRKPRPGLLLQAAEDWRLDLSASYMIGDRMSDVIAGQRAGCTTIWVQSGRHDDAPIESPDETTAVRPADHVCVSLRQAAEWVLQRHAGGAGQ